MNISPTQMFLKSLQKVLMVNAVQSWLSLSRPYPPGPLAFLATQAPLLWLGSLVLTVGVAPVVSGLSRFHPHQCPEPVFQHPFSGFYS